jgi:hypothetical protein
MRKDRTPGIVLPTVFILVGFYLMDESTTHSEWYLDFYLIAGAALSAIGLMTASWTIQRHLAIRRLERNGREHQQAGNQ